MLKAKKLENTDKFVLNLKSGAKTLCDSLLTSRRQSPDDKVKQVTVSFLNKEQTCIVDGAELTVAPLNAARID